MQDVKICKFGHKEVRVVHIKTKSSIWSVKKQKKHSRTPYLIMGCGKLSKLHAYFAEKKVVHLF